MFSELTFALSALISEVAASTDTGTGSPHEQTMTYIAGLVTLTAVVGGAVAMYKKRSSNDYGVEEVEDEDDEMDGSSHDADPNLVPITDKEYTMEEVEAHDADDDCWIVVDGKVYDATPYLERHPGGAYSITSLGGTDTSVAYHEIHSPKINPILFPHQIGVLKKDE